MKICIITEYYPDSEKLESKGGVENRCFNMAVRLSKNHEVTVICTHQKDQFRENKVLGVNIIRVGLTQEYSNNGNILKRLLFSIKSYFTAIKLDFDIIDGFSFLGYLPAILASKFKNKKAVVTYHETWINIWIKNKGLLTGLFGEMWERLVRFFSFDGIISVSEFTKNELLKRNFKQKIYVIYNGINSKEYSKIKTKKIDKQICLVSRLIPSKKVDIAIDAIKILNDKNIKLIIVGQGDEKENLIKKINSNNLENNIQIVGPFENHDDIKKIISSSKLLIHTSIMEGFGIVILEACASDTPYICSDIDVLKEVSRNETGGLLFKANDARDLSNKIELMINNKELYDKKLKECSKLTSFYEWDNIVKEVECVYSEVLNND